MSPTDSWILSLPSWTEPLDLATCIDHVGPLHVDVGCGKGRFLVARAQRLPHVCFLGLEYKLRRLRQADRALRQAGLTNVRLLRAEAVYAMRYLLPDRCVETYYVFFPDPWPKRRHHKRRLFTPSTLTHLYRTLCSGGVVHITTDHAAYAEAIEAVFAADGRFEPHSVFEPSDEERTDYEQTFLAEGRLIRRLAYRARP